jgi:hypothetical protein
MGHAMQDDGMKALAEEQCLIERFDGGIPLHYRPDVLSPAHANRLQEKGMSSNTFAKEKL